MIKLDVIRGLTWVAVAIMLLVTVNRPVAAYPPKDNLSYCYYCNGDHVIDEEDFGYVYMYVRQSSNKELWNKGQPCPNPLCAERIEDDVLIKPAGLLDSTGFDSKTGEITYDDIPLCYRCHTINASQVVRGSRAVNAYLTKIKCDYCHTRKRFDFSMLTLDDATKRSKAELPGDDLADALLDKAKRNKSHHPVRVYTDYTVDIPSEALWPVLETQRVRSTWDSEGNLNPYSVGEWPDAGYSWGIAIRNNGSLLSGYHNGPNNDGVFSCSNCHDDATQATKPAHKGYDTQYRLRADPSFENGYYPIAQGGFEASIDPDPFDTFFVVSSSLADWMMTTGDHKMDSSAPVGTRDEKLFLSNIFCLTCHDDGGRIGNSSFYRDDEYGVGGSTYKGRSIVTPVSSTAYVAGGGGLGRDIVGIPNIAKLWNLDTYGDNGSYLDGDAIIVQDDDGLDDWIREGTPNPQTGEDRLSIQVTGGHLIKSQSGTYLKQGDKVPCVSCHDPHGSLGYNLINDRIVAAAGDTLELATPTSNYTPMQLCLACHKRYNSGAATYVDGGLITRMLEGLHIPKPPERANGRDIGPHVNRGHLVVSSAVFEPGTFITEAESAFAVTEEIVSCIGKYESGGADNGCHFSPHDPRVTDCGGCHYDEFPYRESGQIYGEKKGYYKQHPIYQPLDGDILKWYEQLNKDDMYKDAIEEWVTTTTDSDGEYIGKGYYFVDLDLDNPGNDEENIYYDMFKGPETIGPPTYNSFFDIDGDGSADKDDFFEYVLNRRVEYADIPLGPSKDVWCLSCHNNHEDKVWPFSKKTSHLNNTISEGSRSEWVDDSNTNFNANEKRYKLTHWDQARMRMQIPFVCTRCHEKAFRGTWEYDAATGEEKETLLSVGIATNDHGGFTELGNDMGTVRCPKCHSIHGRSPIDGLEVPIHLGMFRDDFVLSRGEPIGQTADGRGIYKDKYGMEFGEADKYYNGKYVTVYTTEEKMGNPKLLHYKKEFRMCGKCHGSDHDDPDDPLYDHLHPASGPPKLAKNRPPNIYFPSAFNSWREDTLFTLYDSTGNLVTGSGSNASQNWLLDYDEAGLPAVKKRRRSRPLGTYIYDETEGGDTADILARPYNHDAMDPADLSLVRGSDHDMYGEFIGGSKMLIGWPTGYLMLSVRCGMCHDPHGSNSYVQLREIMDIGNVRNGRNDPLEQKISAEQIGFTERVKSIPNVVRAEKMYAKGGNVNVPVSGTVADVDDPPLYWAYKYYGGVDPRDSDVMIKNAGIVTFCTSCHVQLDDKVFDFIAEPDVDGNPYDMRYQRHPVDIDVNEIYNNRIDKWKMRVRYDLEDQLKDQWYDLSSSYKTAAKAALADGFDDYYNKQSKTDVVLEVGYLQGQQKRAIIAFKEFTEPNQPYLGRVVCLTCHKVHGSSYERLRKYDGIKTCVRMCHPYVLKDNEHGQY